MKIYMFASHACFLSFIYIEPHITFYRTNPSSTVRGSFNNISNTFCSLKTIFAFSVSKIDEKGQDRMIDCRI